MPWVASGSHLSGALRLSGTVAFVLDCTASLCGVAPDRLELSDGHCGEKIPCSLCGKETFMLEIDEAWCIMAVGAILEGYL